MTVILIKEMDLSRLMVHSQQIKEWKTKEKEGKRVSRLEQVALILLSQSQKVAIILNSVINLQSQLYLQLVPQYPNSKMIIDIGHHDQSPKAILTVVVQISFARNIVEVIRVSVELTVMYALGMASQAIEFESVGQFLIKVGFALTGPVPSVISSSWSLDSAGCRFQCYQWLASKYIVSPSVSTGSGKFS